MTRTLHLAIPVVAALLTACSQGEPTVDGRWYTQSQLDEGQQVFSANCARCHGAGAQGRADWQTRDAEGHYPAPPLNGTAHAWHHPLSLLKKTVSQGGIPLGGTMPGFADTLSEQQRLSAIAWFQSHWSDEIYNNWKRRGGLD